MPLYWTTTSGAVRSGPVITEVGAAMIAAAGWAVAAASAWWFGDDEPPIPWNNEGGDWALCDGSVPPPRTDGWTDDAVFGG